MYLNKKGEVAGVYVAVPEDEELNKEEEEKKEENMQQNGDGDAKMEDTTKESDEKMEEENKKEENGSGDQEIEEEKKDEAQPSLESFGFKVEGKKALSLKYSTADVAEIWNTVKLLISKSKVSKGRVPR
jgi:hypothetical protein